MKLLDSEHASTAIAVDAFVGMPCVGYHQASQRVRAVDALGKRVLWEAPAEVQVSEVGKSVVLCGGRAYVINDTQLWALDLYTGRTIFARTLESAVQCGFGQPNLWDACHPSMPGNLLVQTISDDYLGLERGFGHTVWTMPDAKDLGPIPVPGGAMITAFDGQELRTMLIDPTRGGFSLFALTASEIRVRAAGRNVLIGTEDIDEQGRSGIAVVEMPVGRVLLQTSAPFDPKRGPPVACGRFVYSADLFRLAASPMGPSVEAELIKGYAIDRLEATHAIVVALMGSLDGEHKLKLVGLDPNTLSVWYTIDQDLGRGARAQEGYEPMASLGPFVCVLGHRGDTESVVTVLHADTGRVGWQHVAMGTPQTVRSEGPYFVVTTSKQTLIYRPELPTPAPVASFP
ncbi:MAG: hypothetical protein Q8Q09_21290 [Deltaproteobacteria bacterium]|nr:hypothetical protein [Deltaproteobacteria bacterium]